MSKLWKKTVHRKLKSLELLETTARYQINPKLVKRIKETYGCIEAVTLRKLPERQLEIDHRIPQIRWATDEDESPLDMTTETMRAKFMLLNRSNNLLKSRACERCKKTGERGIFCGIHFWYKGNHQWDENIGCEGCFWFDPDEWRNSINEKLNESE